MPPLNPWLQRLLVAWAASTVTTGTLLATAENRYRPKKAKRRKKRAEGVAARPRPPALPGTVAKADAAEGYTPSLTWGEWFAAVQVRGQRLLRFVTGQPPIGSVDDDGSRIPDEVVTAGGQKVKVSTPSSRGSARKKKRRQPAPPQKRGRRQKRQATLYESARESLRQVVKEEAQKAVDETVEEAGLGKARDALKTASEAVGKTAATVAEKVKESIPEDFDEKVQTAGRSFFAGARRAVQKLGESLQSLPDLTLDDAPAPPPTPIDTRTVEALPAESPPTESQVVDLLATMAALDGSAAVGTPPADASPPPSAPTTAVATTTTPPADGPPGPQEGLGIEDLAEKVGDGVQLLGGGVQKLGAFLSGPGNPGYQGGGRRPRRAVGDVVEARDAPTTPKPTDDANTG